MIKVTTSELEHMIRSAIKSKGLGADITNDRIKEIKNTIKSKISGMSPGVSAKNETVVDVPATIPQDTPGAVPTAVTSAVSSDPNATAVAKKEGELEQKETDISNREAQLANRQAELQRKQDELTYEPQIPAVLNNIGPEKVFVFDTNEMSVGAEALSKTNFRMVSNPDEKKSINDLWLEAGVRKAEVFIVKFEKLGEVTFDPFRGTAVFEEKRFESDETPEAVPADGLTPEQAKQSQEAHPLSDAIEPVKDVTLPLSDNMGLDTLDIQSIIDKKVEQILKNYVLNKV